jgi:hypothetical protein
MMAITTIKIHPAIGIARLGNSPTAFFIGPEIPGDHTPPAGGYKDSQCRIKRQAARFRLYAYDENGALIIENGQPKEITAADATISWTAHLANTKAAWLRFQAVGGNLAPPPPPNAAWRNAAVADRSSLRIDPGARTIAGPNQAAGFNTGHFLGIEVPLGEMQTDENGRLLILGGFGSSGSPNNSPLNYWAENDGWHDDISDGPIRATVTLNGMNNPIQAVPAWVICAPPKFAPSIPHIITLYDTLYQLAVDNLGVVPPGTPSFNHDIFPILDRAAKVRWLNAAAAAAHSSLSAVIPPPGAQAVRQAIVNRHRDPNLAPHDPGPPGRNMPLMWSDVFDTAQDISAALTKTQFNHMQQWAAGNFTNDWNGSPPPPDTQITPDGLDRAALENCIGAAFFPGIETSWMTRDVYAYLEPFRLDASQRSPGDLTKQMALPWQTDFLDCSDGDAPLLWWPAARPDDVWPEDGSPQARWIRDLISSTTPFDDMVANWHRLGFVVQKGTDFLETERHVICRSCTLVTDRSTFSKDQVDALISAGSTATFADSFYVMVEGFKPSELGVTTANPSPAQLAAIAPQITFTRPDNTPTPGISATPQALLLQNPALPNSPQRFTFVYSISFSDTNLFTQFEVENESVAAAIQGLMGTGIIRLTNQPNPFMLDGPTNWLSIDLRVFQAQEGVQPFQSSGIMSTVGNDSAGAVNFIQSLLGQMSDQAFATISTDQQTSKLELSRTVNGKRVFNFAIAQVRYVAQNLPAADVRVFFRLFTTAATGLDYNSGSTYRRFEGGGNAIPLLGFQGGEVVSVPCFAAARVNTTAVSMNQQTDPVNVQTISPGGANEVHKYFGCWLDFNQDDKVIPILANSGDGPYVGTNVQSVHDAIRGLHQCLVAEVFFAGDPIPAGATPASNDNLSQRNLAIVESDNPGGPESHTVAHTFELKPSALAAAGFERVAIAASQQRAMPPDELMLRWYNLPEDTDITLFLPQVSASSLLTQIGRTYEAKRLELVDEQTLRCLAGDVTYIPIPALQGPNLAGLMTLILPDTVKQKQMFRVVAHQISGFRQFRRVIGSFQLTIPVSTAANLLEAEIRTLSVLRDIAKGIKPSNRWHPVFARYLDQVGGRVRGFGGDPDRVRASIDGDGGVICPPSKSVLCPGDLFCLNIPWKDCDVEGEVRIKLRFRKKSD